MLDVTSWITATKARLIYSKSKIHIQVHIVVFIRIVDIWTIKRLINLKIKKVYRLRTKKIIKKKPNY